MPKKFLLNDLSYKKKWKKILIIPSYIRYLKKVFDKTANKYLIK